MLVVLFVGFWVFADVDLERVLYFLFLGVGCGWVVFCTGYLVFVGRCGVFVFRSCCLFAWGGYGFGGFIGFGWG